MADRTYDVDAKEIEKLQKFLKRSPQMFAVATGSMLNDFAFGVQNTAIEVIHEQMTVRNSRFVTGSVRVEMSNRRQPITNQQSATGSIQRKRFSGWTEQQTGKRTARERVITKLGRRKNETRKLIGTARLKSANKFETYHKYPGRGPEQKSTIMLQKLDRRRFRKPFIITKKKGMRAGVYKFLRRRPRLLQVFDSDKVQPEKIPWMADAVDRYFEREDLPRLWSRTLKRILNL